MMAMQYSFTLPADYDMEIIDRRIRDKGPAMDGFPHLGFKAFLSARRGEFGSRENLYAPFYLWNQPEGASDFICGPGFAALTDAFGRPRIRHWIVWHAHVLPDLGSARFADSEYLAIEPHVSLPGLRQQEIDLAKRKAGSKHVLARIAAFDPHDWTMVRFGLYAEAPTISGTNQIYRIGHLSRD
ncbi:hypothetical protein FHX08_005892 [Rhizobium sp. BK529]|uniref:DUF4865 family protein n=1 Tax=unclassified Rhizobium TaxID=2613769 RepID=UPI00104BDCF7|nr:MULTISPECIES: DUF4865 family protein [unclassified Rhizobium]MBB3595480.1 hypothetical protein [Rhizobium sp. BK529]TCS00728.1 uncharacterized protein DUF4865 [Rhizobium sp. BK418]